MSDALADSYPRLAACLPRIPLADLPTPVTRAALQTTAGNRSVLIKDDGMSGALYGGNKVRKLEFLLAEALNQGTDLVITCGAVQSNHCRAVAVAASVQPRPLSAESRSSSSTTSWWRASSCRRCMRPKRIWLRFLTHSK